MLKKRKNPFLLFNLIIGVVHHFLPKFYVYGKFILQGKYFKLWLPWYKFKIFDIWLPQNF